MSPQRLRAVRLSLRLSHSQFAAALGVEPSDVARWESDTPPRPDPFVLALATAYVELCVEAAAASGTRAHPIRSPLPELKGAMAVPC